MATPRDLGRLMAIFNDDMRAAWPPYMLFPVDS